MNTVRSVWETVGAYVHAQRELACTANISIAHERILLTIIILLGDNQMNTVRYVWETVGACMHAQRELACTANISIAHKRILLKF